jgi:hypothetical protein
MVITGNLWEQTDPTTQPMFAGDFDGDGRDDLAIGDPMQDLGPANEVVDAGILLFAFGAPAGFDLSRSVAWSDPSGAEAGDHFGWALAAADFDRDGRDDLAAGHPLEDWTATNEGAVSILMGNAGSGVGARSRTFGAGREAIPGEAQSHQDFGRALAAGDFDGDGHADLAIGAPWFDVSPDADRGMEAVLYGALYADGFEAGSAPNWSDSAP